MHGTEGALVIDSPAPARVDIDELTPQSSVCSARNPEVAGIQEITGFSHEASIRCSTALRLRDASAYHRARFCKAPDLFSRSTKRVTTSRPSPPSERRQRP